MVRLRKAHRNPTVSWREKEKEGKRQTKSRPEEGILARGIIKSIK